MTAQQHLDDARRYLDLALEQTGRDYEKSAMYASISAAHAQIAAAMGGAR